VKDVSVRLSALCMFINFKINNTLIIDVSKYIQKRTRKTFYNVLPFTRQLETSVLMMMLMMSDLC